MTRRASSWTPYIPHRPTPRQADFLALTTDEGLYGGAAGGGKSDGVLMDQLRFVERPGFTGMLFRKTYADLSLPGALMDRAHEWLAGSGARWNDQKKIWTFSTAGAPSRVGFGYLETDADMFRYQGMQVHRIGVDELTQWRKAPYLYLTTRIRKLSSDGIPCGMRGATNPGGIGHEWVHERFIDPETAIAPFVPAGLKDNPHLDQADYAQRLAKLDAVTRAQLLDGLWVRDSGGLIYPVARANIIDRLPVMPAEALHWGLAVDLGSSERAPTTAFVVFCWHEQLPGVFIVYSEKRAGMIPSSIAERMLELEHDFATTTFEFIVMDEGALGKGYGNEMRERWKIPVKPAEKPNKLGFRKLMRGALERTELLIVGPQNEALLAEMGSLSWDEEGLDAEEGVADHLTDAALYGWRECTSYHYEPPEPRLADPVAQQALEERQRDIRAHEKRARQQWWSR